MRLDRKRLGITIPIVLTAALTAAVFLSGIFLPGYSKPTDKTVKDEKKGITVVQKQRKIEVWERSKKIWELPSGVLAQDVLLEDIDQDGEKDLMILCWKRGRYGKKKPVWVKHDEIWWSQHIYIYRIVDGKVIPKWMASDIGMKAAHWEYEDGMLVITDKDNEKTKWKWVSWGLEKVW